MPVTARTINAQAIVTLTIREMAGDVRSSGKYSVDDGVDAEEEEEGDEDAASRGWRGGVVRVTMVVSMRVLSESV
jgi:hypothetical protein